MLNDYLKYINRCYNPEKHGRLLDLEKDYLLAIRGHYLNFPENDPTGEIVALVDAVFKKL